MRQQRRFSRIGKADQSNVGEKLQGDVKFPRLSSPARVCEVGGLPGGGCETRVPPSPPASPGGAPAFPVSIEIRDGFAFFRGFFLEENGTDGDSNDDVGAVGAGLPAPRSGAARFGFEPVSIAEVEQGVQVPVRQEDNVASASSIAPVRSAAFDELLSSEADTPVPTAARDGGN